MDQQTENVVRGTCGCGKRYRVRNATAGVSVTCPACSRVITISRADIDAANEKDDVLPLAISGQLLADAKEAILLDNSAVRLAARGARPGITDTIRYTNEEALLNRALSGRSIQQPTGYTAFGGRAFEPVIKRPFALDLLASFWFAGSSRNAANIAFTAACCFMIQIVGGLAVGPFFGVSIVLQFVLFAYLYQFLWVVMKETAAGEDDVPWFDWEFDLYETCVLPSCWLTAITIALTGIPLTIVNWTIPPGPDRWIYALWAVAIGWFFFPVAVMCVAIGHSIKALRPDHLIRALIAIGPWYFFAWPIVMVVLAGWVLLPFSARLLAAQPWFSSIAASFALMVFLKALATALNFYFGYVLFRMIGLLFRHFRHRLPWGF